MANDDNYTGNPSATGDNDSDVEMDGEWQVSLHMHGVGMGK